MAAADHRVSQDTQKGGSQVVRSTGLSRVLAIGMSAAMLLSTGAVVIAQDEEQAADEVQKVILDTDMVELFDDGMAMFLLDKAPNIDLLGVTVVAGNTPMPRGVATGVRQLEAIESDTPIYEGSRLGIRNWRAIPESPRGGAGDQPHHVVARIPGQHRQRGHRRRSHGRLGGGVRVPL